MYNGDPFYMLVIYLCGDGEAASDEMRSQIIVCFIFYAKCLFLKLFQNAQTRRRGDIPDGPMQQILRFSSFCSAIFMLVFQMFRRCEMEKRWRRAATVGDVRGAPDPENVGVTSEKW